jgi:glutaminase
MKVRLKEGFDRIYRAFEDQDPALEFCENLLLDNTLPGWTMDLRVDPQQYELFQNLSPEEIAQLVPLLRRKSFDPGEVIIQAGAPARELFFLARGHVSVFLSLASGARKRLATFSPGMAFGEMAIIEQAPRSATVLADTLVECDLLLLDDFADLNHSHPQIKIKLLENLSRVLSSRLREARQELQLFS